MVGITDGGMVTGKPLGSPGATLGGSVGTLVGLSEGKRVGSTEGA